MKQDLGNITLFAMFPKSCFMCRRAPNRDTKLKMHQFNIIGERAYMFPIYRLIYKLNRLGRETFASGRIRSKQFGSSHHFARFMRLGFNICAGKSPDTRG